MMQQVISLLLLAVIVLCQSTATVQAFSPIGSTSTATTAKTAGVSSSWSTQCPTQQQQQRLPQWGSSATGTTPRWMGGTVLFGKKAARAQGNDRKNKTERVKKQKDDVIEIEATVLESLPNAMFRCAIDGAPETQPPILATISGKIRKNFVKILVGDRVTIELSPYDLTRGRITFRHRG